MHRWHILIGVAAALVGGAVGVGFAAGGHAPQVLPAAMAGGIIQAPGGAIWTVSPDGDVIYEWQVGGGQGTVVRYDSGTGESLRRSVLRPLPPKPAAGAPGAPGAAPVDPDEDQELKVTGVIWTPDVARRNAIINGQIVRVGETVTGKSGKLYRVLSIHKDREVEFEELKDK